MTAEAEAGPSPVRLLHWLAAAFGCASVAVYFANDVADGELPKSHAITLSTVSAAAGIIAGVIISEPLLTVSVGGYLGISFLYSGVLKHIPVLELLFVTSGFLLRVLGGAAATHVRPSGWFLLVCSLGTFGVAAAKRYTELASLGPEAIAHRPAMRRYRAGALRLALFVAGL